MILTIKVSYVNKQCSVRHKQTAGSLVNMGKLQCYCQYLPSNSYFSGILLATDPVSIIDNNTGTYCGKKDSKHYFKHIFIFLILRNFNSSTQHSVSTKKCSIWCVTKYMTVNLDIISLSLSLSSHPTEFLLYVVELSCDVSCFVTWWRKQIFLYGTTCS